MRSTQRTSVGYLVHGAVVCMSIARPRRSQEILAAGSPRSVVKRTSASRCHRVHKRLRQLRRGDGEEAPFAGDALELVNATLLELDP